MAKKPDKQRKLTVFLGDDLEKAVDKHAKKTGEGRSSMVRRLLANEVGKPELANSVKMGRPRKSPKGV